MKYTNYLLYTTLILFLTAGFSACSQNKQTKTKAIETKSADVDPISVTMYKNPDCQCCEQWAAYMEENGYSVTSKPSNTLAVVKEKYGVPSNVSACHTALIKGYVVEGHVPVEAVNKLLKARPEAKGIAVLGMPAGAPGTKGERSAVDVYFFNGPDHVAYFGKF